MSLYSILVDELIKLWLAAISQSSTLDYSCFT